MDYYEKKLEQHNITDLRSINDKEFLNMIAAKGKANISIVPVKFNKNTNIVEFRVVINQFSLLIKVLHVLRNIDSGEDEGTFLGSGGFGSIRAHEWDKRYIAVKRQHFYVQSNFY
jgi:hypothetical protein